MGASLPMAKASELLNNGGESYTVSASNNGVVSIKLNGNDMSVDDYIVVAVSVQQSLKAVATPYINHNGAWRVYVTSMATNDPLATSTVINPLTFYYKKVTD